MKITAPCITGSHKLYVDVPFDCCQSLQHETNQKSDSINKRQRIMHPLLSCSIESLMTSTGIGPADGSDTSSFHSSYSTVMPKDFCRAKYEPVSLESREGCRTGHDSPSTDCRSGGLDELEAIEKRVRADLLAEGFQTVQTWSEPANTCYEDQAYSHDVIVHIVRGSLVIVHGDQVTGMTVGRSKVLPGEVAFALRIGPHGCRYIFAY